MAENHLKTRIRRILRSCISKDLIAADVTEARRRRQRFHLSELFSPLQPPRSSLSYSLLMADEEKSASITDEKNISPCHVEGRKCPPSSPIIPPLCARKTKMTRSSGSTTSYKKGLGFVEVLPEQRTYNKGLYERQGGDSMAVVKRSRDPYSDFRASMVEMIVEKQMFGAEDLENLLECFLTLNSRRHHEVIVRAFAEIWEALLL